jgi:hypothetical protein
MQEFYINQNSVNPVLRMELTCDGRYDFKKSNIFNHSIQNADITFSMKNTENGILKISKNKAEVIQSNDDGCEEKYMIQYSWNKRDVREKGKYKGWFEINFKGDLYEGGVPHPNGNLIVPIEDELMIYIL